MGTTRHYPQYLSYLSYSPFEGSGPSVLSINVNDTSLTNVVRPGLLKCL